MTTRRWLMVVVAAIVSVVVAVLASGVLKKPTHYGVASAQLLVDSRPSLLTQINPTVTATSLASIATLYAEYGTSDAMTAAIAQDARVPPSAFRVAASAGQPVSSPVSTGSTQKVSSANQGADSINISADGVTPTIRISVQAGKAEEAQRLAAATITAFQSGLKSLDKSSGGSVIVRAAGTTVKKVSTPVVLRELGGVTAGSTTSPTKTSKAVEIGVAVFVVLLIVFFLVDTRVLGRARSRQVAAEVIATDS